MTEHSNRLKCELYNDSMQNWKSKPIQKAQLIIADVPYNVGNNFYGSNPMWYVGGDNKNGESDKAGKKFFWHLGRRSGIEHNGYSRSLCKAGNREVCYYYIEGFVNSADTLRFHEKICYDKKYCMDGLCSIIR